MEKFANYQFPAPDGFSLERFEGVPKGVFTENSDLKRTMIIRKGTGGPFDEFTKIVEKKGLSLPGLIDIIFLLLIFSLGTLSFSESAGDKDQGGEESVDLQLPEARVTDTFKADEVLQTLLYN